MFDRRLVKCFDWGLLGLTLTIATAGIVTLYSAVTAGAPTPQRVLYVKQLIWFGGGLGVMVCCFLVNYRFFERWAPGIYVGSIGLLVWVLAFGRYISGSRRWLILGPISLQPSEVMKVAVIVMLARYLRQAHRSRRAEPAPPPGANDLYPDSFCADRQTAGSGDGHAHFAGGCVHDVVCQN